MFCPKCGTGSNETQKFCKACGTNLQLVSDALGGGGDSLGVLKLDVVSLNRKAAEFARTLKPEWDNFWKNNGLTSGEGSMKIQPRHSHHSDDREVPEATRERLPRNWMSYSWQHSMKIGLINLLTGAGIGALFFYLSRAAIDSGAISDLEVLTRVRGLGQIASMLWLLGILPALKGIGHIFYAALFAPSIFKLAQQLKPPSTTPLQAPPPLYSAINEAPSSVTEHTTQFFEEAKSRGRSHKRRA